MGFNQNHDFELGLVQRYSTKVDYLYQELQYMEAEPDNTQLVITNNTRDQELVDLIVRSFKGRTQEEVKQASDLMLHSLGNPGMIDKMIEIMTAANEPRPNLKKAVALLIKKYSFQYAHLPGDKSKFVQSVYALIMKPELEFTAKEVLGMGLQSILNADKEGRYKRVVVEKTLSIFQSNEGLQNLEGCLVVFQSFFNTLSDIEEQFEHFSDIIQPLNATSMNLLNEVNSMSFQSFLTCDKPIMIKISKVFSFLEHILEVIFQEADQYPEEITNIRENPFLIELLQNYLVLFHDNNSILSKKYSQINQIKRVIMNVVVTLYRLSVCPLKIFKLAYVTFLSESNRIVDDFEIEAVLVLCIELMDDHLERKQYEELFAQKKLDTMFALFLYSVTNLEEYQYMEENPQKFVQIAEDFTEANSRKDYLKIKAGAMLQVFIQKIDEALRSVVDILIMICAEILQSENKTEVPQIEQSFGKYAFYRLSEELKLETSFMVLANLSRFINRRYDLYKLVNSFLASHFTNILQVKSHLPILRIIRLISYFPTAIYFVYIESHLTEGKVFIIEGIKSFERIIKTNRYPELLGILASIFVRLMGVIRISDPIMQIVVINHHGTMLKRQPALYKLCLQKIRQEFFANRDTNQHATMICFNLISALLEKQKEEEDRKDIISLFYEIDEHLLQQQNRDAFNRYEEKLIQIIDVIITLRNFSTPQIEKFVERTMRYLSRYEKGSAIFKMYNNYLCKMEGAVFKLEKYFQAFWEEVKHRVQLFFQKEESLDSISFYCLLMSQIIGNNTQLNLSDSDFDQILTIAGRVTEQYKQYPLLIFLSYAYESPYQIVAYLKKKNVYQNFLEEVTKVKFEGQLPKKIIILALIRLVEIEEQLSTFKIIMEYCVKYLKLQYQKSKKILSKIPTYQVRPRRLGEERLVDNEDLEEEGQNDNQLVNIFGKFKHPYRNLSEYNNFKVILSHRHGLLNELSPETMAEIKSILQTQWVDNKTRRILHVK